MTTLTDTQLLDMIEQHDLEVYPLIHGDEEFWNVFTTDGPSVRAPTLRAALHRAYTELVARKLIS